MTKLQQFRGAVFALLVSLVMYISTIGLNFIRAIDPPIAVILSTIAALGIVVSTPFCAVLYLVYLRRKR